MVFPLNLSAAEQRAVAVFDKGGYPKHIRSTSARLFEAPSGVLAYPFGVWRKLPEFAFYDDTPLRGGPMSANKEEWMMNKKARKFLGYAKTFTPQVLFRGFTPASGGGENELLNGPHGVVPHGFLDGKIPTSMWHTLHLSDMISGHLEGDESIVSDFSSWTQTWMTALYFSRYRHDKEARIAVLDTSSIEEHVWSSCDLLRADLTEDEYPDEYLIYGPITGPKYHYVSPYELYNKTRIADLLGSDPSAFGQDPGSSAIETGSPAIEPGSSVTDPGSSATDPSSSATDPGSSDTQPGPSTTDPGSSATEPGSPAIEPGSSATDPDSSDTQPGPSAIEPGAVESAMAVAAFLQPRSGRGETLAVLTARFVSYRAARITRARRLLYLSYEDIEKYLTCVESQIDHLAKHAQDGEVVLVDATMYAEERYLKFEVQLLQAVENAVRVRAHELRATM